MESSIFNTFLKDYGMRLARTALQVFFGSIMVGATDGAFTDAQVEQVVGAILLIFSLIPTGFSAWKVAREKKVAQLAEKGELSAAAKVARGEEPKGLY